MSEEKEAKLWSDIGVIERAKVKDKKTLYDTWKILGLSEENLPILEKIIEIGVEKYKENQLLIRNYLKDPDIFNLITKDELDKQIIGELGSRQVIFLSACGRLVKNCQIASFNLLVNDEAGAGKDYITGRTLAIIPKENYIKKTRISPAVFTYWHNKEKEPEWTWDGKVFYPEDISEVVLNSDVFKVMCSSGSSATILIRQQAVDLEIEGKPVMITTTATATPNPELVRRFSILNLDGSENQTKSIMKRHSEYKKRGIVPDYNQDIIEAQRLLERVNVKIPFADLIDEHFPSKNIIMRTLYPRFLDYISASTALHQFQRQRDTEDFVLAEGQDYDIARQCFLKLCSNKYMIPLTINQKQIFSEFEKHLELKGSVSQLHPILKINLTDKSLQSNLRLLVKYGILDAEEGKDEWNHPTELYFMSKGYNPNEKIEIPTYEEICNNTSLTTGTSLTTPTSITTPTNEKENVREVIEVTEAQKGNQDNRKCTECGSPNAFIIVEDKLYCPDCYRSISK